MTYYPKSQVQIDLFTQGKELEIISSKEEYTGYYWKNSKGKYFTGRNPSTPSPIPLQPVSKVLPSQINMVTLTPLNPRYNTLKNTNIDKFLLLPYYQKPSPTTKDYEIGSFVRYFAKKSNQNLYIETSKDIFDQFTNQNQDYDYLSYIVFNLTWTLRGKKSSVKTINQKIITTTEKKLNIQGLNSYLNFNYLEFYK
tara:strand:+ start:4625 stop:5212 length:588 start_codon:yes stop_codon:yes gene_type:complete